MAQVSGGEMCKYEIASIEFEIAHLSLTRLLLLLSKQTLQIHLPSKRGKIFECCDS